jgi:hypothetical protein
MRQFIQEFSRRELELACARELDQIRAACERDLIRCAAAVDVFHRGLLDPRYLTARDGLFFQVGSHRDRQSCFPAIIVDHKNWSTQMSEGETPAPEPALAASLNAILTRHTSYLVLAMTRQAMEAAALRSTQVGLVCGASLQTATYMTFPPPDFGQVLPWNSMAFSGADAAALPLASLPTLSLPTISQ